MLIRTVNKFSMSLSPSASDSPGTLEVKFYVPVHRPNHIGSPPSCRETLTISSNFLFSRTDQRVSIKSGGTSTGKPVAEANLMTCIERFKQEILKSSQVRRTGFHQILMCGWTWKMCTDNNHVFCGSVLCLFCRFRLQLKTRSTVTDGRCKHICAFQANVSARRGGKHADTHAGDR